MFAESRQETFHRRSDVYSRSAMLVRPPSSTKVGLALSAVGILTRRNATMFISMPFHYYVANYQLFLANLSTTGLYRSRHEKQP
jgi:hypothetical protein